MFAERTTLAQYLIEERRDHPEASGDLNSLILGIALACKAISRRVAHGSLAGVLGDHGTVNVQGEVQKKLDVVSNDIFTRAGEWGGALAGMASEEIEAPIAIPERYPRGKYLLLFDPLDGSSNIDVNVSVGSIFSIQRTPNPGEHATVADFLQCGAEQVFAGYAIYGPSTMLVISVGSGTHGFTLDPELGEFILTHPGIVVPAVTSEFAINMSNSRFWEPAVKRYVDECLAGKIGPRGRDFNMRWVASLVAEAHRVSDARRRIPVSTRHARSEHAEQTPSVVRSEPDLVPDRTGWRSRQHRPRTPTRCRAEGTARARRFHLRIERRGRSHRAISPRSQPA